MSEIKFTPGPWEVVLDFPPHERLYVRTHRKKKNEFFDFEKCICGCGFPNGVCDGGKRKANAYLIAAAPEMYEALDEALDFIEQLWCRVQITTEECEDTCDAIMTKGCAALRKARGAE